MKVRWGQDHGELVHRSGDRAWVLRGDGHDVIVPWDRITWAWPEWGSEVRWLDGEAERVGWFAGVVLGEPLRVCVRSAGVSVLLLDPKEVRW